MQVTVKAKLKEFKAKSLEDQKDPVAVITVEAPMKAPEIGRLAALLGEGLSVTLASLQTSFDVSEGGDGSARLTLDDAGDDER